jgi:hypothetical protein
VWYGVSVSGVVSVMCVCDMVVCGVVWCSVCCVSVVLFGSSSGSVHVFCV